MSKALKALKGLTKVCDGIWTAPRHVDKVISQALKNAGATMPCSVIYLDAGESIERWDDERLAKVGLARLPRCAECKAIMPMARYEMRYCETCYDRFNAQ